MLENTNMKESRQSQPGNLNLVDKWVRVCDTCGDIGVEKDLVPCSKCTDGAEHIYCMRVKLHKVPEGWMCEECNPRAGINNLIQDNVEDASRRMKGHLFESSTNFQSSKGSQLNIRSLDAGKSGTNGGSSTIHLLAKRHGVPFEAQSMKKFRDIETSFLSPRSSGPCNNSLLHKDFSCKKFKKVKIKSINDIVNSLPKSSCDSQEKEKAPHDCGDREYASTLAKKGKALKTRVISPKASNSHNHSPLGRKSPSKKLGKVKVKVAGSFTSLKQSSCGVKKKAKLTYCLGDGSQKLGSQTEMALDKCTLLNSSSSKASNLKSEGHLAKIGHLQKQKVMKNPTFRDDRNGKDLRTTSKSMSFNCVILEESNDTCSEVFLADAYESHNPAMCSQASDFVVTAKKNEKDIVSSGETLFSASNFCNLNGVESSGQLDHRLQASNHNIHKDSNCLTEGKKNEIQQAKTPTKATITKSIYKICPSPISKENSHLRDLTQVEAATFSQGLVIPKSHYTWIGKFQIHNTERTIKTCDGIQAHLSTCASLKVLEVVDKLPKIIILEELPRLRVWPSQFMGSQVTEENIALYFFAKDVYSYDTYYVGLMNYMTKNDLALKGNLNGVELLIFSSNNLLEKAQRWNQMLYFWGVFKGRKVNNSTNIPHSDSLKSKDKDTMKSRAFDLNSYPQDEDYEVGVDEILEFDNISGIKPSRDRIMLAGDSSNSKGPVAKPKCVVTDVDLSPRTKSTIEENGFVRIENNVEEPSTSLSLLPPSTTIQGENLDPLDWQLAETLIILSRDKF